MDYSLSWDRILFNGLPFSFLWEVALRCTIMFIILVVVLALTGKRGIKQLSIFETVIIIALGSAAGDPMFYEDVGLVPALLVFIIVLVLYRSVVWLTGKSRWFERLMEGRTECIIDEGKFSKNKFDNINLAQDEFFTELRLKNVEHLGQVKKAYLETTGDVSVFFYEDAQVKPGLPIVPELFDKKSKHIETAGLYACSKCGNTKPLTPGQHTCEVCRNKKWILTIHTKRLL